MTKKHWFIFAAILALGGLGLTLILALGLGIFIEHQTATADGSNLPVYTLDQTNSAHAGYRRTTLTSGSEIYVNDYDEAALQLTTSEPKPAIGRYGIGVGNVCAIPGQPTTAYIAGDCGSEMPAYEPFRNVKQPPFDWRTATFREMNFLPPGGHSNWRSSTNATLIAEVVRLLRDGTPVELPDITFVSAHTNLYTLKLASDQLPGLLFCPPVCVDAHGQFYLAESLMLDYTAPNPPQLHARWIPASPLLTEWLKAQ